MCCWIVGDIDEQARLLCIAYKSERRDYQGFGEHCILVYFCRRLKLMIIVAFLWQLRCNNNDSNPMNGVDINQQHEYDIFYIHNNSVH